MAVTITGTNGNDTLVAPDGESVIIDALDGEDSITSFNNFATISGGLGNDTMLLIADFPGSSASGGSGDDSIEYFSASSGIGPLLLGNLGNDTIRANPNYPGTLTIIGGDGSFDGNDSLASGIGSDLIFGNGGRDTINGGGGNNTLIGGQGDDSIFTPGNDSLVGQNDLVFGNEGDDTINVYPGNDTVFAGQGRDSVIALTGSGQFFLNEGSDTFNGSGNVSDLIVAGGNDSADLNDSISTGSGNDVVFGNGGLDTINGGNGNNTLIGGFDVDSIIAGSGQDIIFGNEGNDTINVGVGGPDTVFGGQGSDSIFIPSGFTNQLGSLFGNEGNDTIRAYGAETIAGGAGRDVFVFPEGQADGSSARPAFITDLDFGASGDRFSLPWHVDFTAQASAGGAVDLFHAAANAVTDAWHQAGSGSVRVAATFTFQGRAYLVADSQTFGQFEDSLDLLLDVTGAISSIGSDNFI